MCAYYEMEVMVPLTMYYFVCTKKLNSRGICTNGIYRVNIKMKIISFGTNYPN